MARVRRFLFDGLFSIRIIEMKSYHNKIVLFAALLVPFISLGIIAKTLAGTANSMAIVPAPTSVLKGTPNRMPTPSPTPSATPTPTPTPNPTPAPIKTLADLQAKIASRMSIPELRRGRVGIKIVSLNSGKVIFENDADKYFMPASNMKNFTIAAAMERLGPDFKFVTSVFANAKPDSIGTIKGDLRVYGRGDISISTAFFGTTLTDPETYYKGIDRLVDKIAAAGVKRIEGSIVGDETYFRGFAIPGTWEWDDLQWYYGAEISALPINDSAVDLSITPGKDQGGPCVVTISPPNRLFQIKNLCQTIGTGRKRQLRVDKKIDRNVLEISGTIPADDKGYKSSIAVTHPAELFVTLLKERLEKRGIIVTGQIRTVVNSPSEEGRPLTARSPPFLILAKPSETPSGPVEIAKLESPPFREIAAKTMKPSQNMFTETILWTMGETSRQEISKNYRLGGKPDSSAEELLMKDSSFLGVNVVKAFLKQIGIPDDGIIQYDGSGLSRHDEITPDAVVRLYTYMAKESKNAQAWRDSLSIGGVDGTLESRFKGTAAAGNIRGKTGTIDQVSALSGYLTTATGEQLVISIIVNGVAEPRMRTLLADDIVISLVNFSGKID